MYRATGVDPTKLIARTFGMIHQRVYRRFAAVHQIHDALGQPRFFDQFIDVAHE